MASKFFSSLKVGPLTLPNRIVMAPLTRCRATADGVPTDLMIKHYTARADAGLLITEATLVSLEGRGVPNTPGVWNAEQAAQWKAVTDSVHAAGGRIFCQLWHQGRTASAALNGGVTPVGPSAIAFTDGYGQPAAAPRALETAEIARVIADYRRGAELALEAGFDGVELHAANGYLPNQFLVDGANKRTDGYGGSIENRTRFLTETMQALIAVWGAERVGVRISPASHWQDITDSDPIALYTHVAKELQALGPLAYVHVVEPRDTGFGATADPVDTQLTAAFIRHVGGLTSPVFSAGGHDYKSGLAYLEDGKADGVVYGRWYIANPDLVRRFARGPDTPLNAYDRSTFYGGDEQGYNSYPTLEEVEAQQTAAKTEPAAATTEAAATATA